MARDDAHDNLRRADRGPPRRRRGHRGRYRGAHRGDAPQARGQVGGRGRVAEGRRGCHRLHDCQSHLSARQDLRATPQGLRRGGRQGIRSLQRGGEGLDRRSHRVGGHRLRVGAKESPRFYRGPGAGGRDRVRGQRRPHPWTARHFRPVPYHVLPCAGLGAIRRPGAVPPEEVPAPHRRFDPRGRELRLRRHPLHRG